MKNLHRRLMCFLANDEDENEAQSIEEAKTVENPIMHSDSNPPFQRKTSFLASGFAIAMFGSNHAVNRQEEDDSNNFDYSQRGQWLRAAVLGANDGLVSVASLMMGVGAVKEDVRAMLLAGFAGTIAGACSMAIGEYVSVHTQYDIELMQMERELKDVKETGEAESRKNLPNPFQAALTSAFAFCVGALLPLLSAAFIKNYKVRLAVVVFVASLALVGFGGLGAVLGKTPVVRSCFRVLVGGWIAMVITFWLTKALDSGGVHL